MRSAPVFPTLGPKGPPKILRRLVDVALVNLGRKRGLAALGQSCHHGLVEHDDAGVLGVDERSVVRLERRPDIRQGIVGSTLLAMFRKLGHPIKTVVSPVVMDAVKDKNVQATPLEWGVPLKGKVGNGQAVFYALHITQAQITQGFIIQVRLCEEQAP